MMPPDRFDVYTYKNMFNTLFNIRELIGPKWDPKYTVFWGGMVGLVFKPYYF